MCRARALPVLCLGLALGTAVAPAAFADAAPASGGGQKAGVLKTFKDWVVGCDNTRSCSAIGMNPDADAMGGYMKIERSGDADALPVVRFTTWPDDESVTPVKPTVRLSIDAHKAGGVPAEALAGVVDGSLVHVTLSAEQAADFLLALRTAKVVTVSLLEDTQPIGKQAVSLAGSAAALLYMDDEQKRIGTVTALSKTGAAAASTIPAPPATPVVPALKITELSDPLPPMPKGIGKPSADDCAPDTSQPTAFSLPDGQALWGVCAFTGAYNFGYTFWWTGKAKPSLVNFAIPGQKPDPDLGPNTLVNPYVEEDGVTLGSFNKGRGLGDCGDATDWAWDGRAFQVLSHSEMPQCRGVTQEDWPVLYRSIKG